MRADVESHDPPGSASDTVPAVRLAGISKTFGSVVANRSVDMDAFAGEIHALLGENGAGKSTLMKIAAGFLKPDAGRVEVGGRLVNFRKPQHALSAGIGMVYQHFTLVPTLTVAENVALRPASMPGRSSVRASARRVAALAAELGLRIDPGRRVSELSVSERQCVEILKLIDRGANLLIFDEPSASLSPLEWREISGLVKRLAGAGRAAILITHRLDEAFALADRYTVLRNGSVTGHGRMTDTSREELVRDMVGQAVSFERHRVRFDPGAAQLKVDELTVLGNSSRDSARSALTEISFEVRSREILGVAGVAGSGQRELIESLLGLIEATETSVMINDRLFSERSPGEFFARGGAYIPEDRHTDGASTELTVWENLLLRDATRAPLARNGFIRKSRARARARELMELFDIRGESPDVRFGQLSGGNQQKVVLARELAADPQLILAVQPTRGLDVRSMKFVHEQLLLRKRRGCGVLLVSMDLDEILALADRIMVLAAGRVQGILDAEEASMERIGSLMTVAHRDAALAT